MARKDEIFKNFINHELIKENYEIDEKELPDKLVDGLKSSIPIIRSIALIVDNLESISPASDNSLRNIVTQFLSETAL